MTENQPAGASRFAGGRAAERLAILMLSLWCLVLSLRNTSDERGGPLRNHPASDSQQSQTAELLRQSLRETQRTGQQIGQALDRVAEAVAVLRETARQAHIESQELRQQVEELREEFRSGREADHPRDDLPR